MGAQEYRQDLAIQTLLSTTHVYQYLEEIIFEK
jgi:hypothetical protein